MSTGTTPPLVTTGTAPQNAVEVIGFGTVNSPNGNGVAALDVTATDSITGTKVGQTLPPSATTFTQPLGIGNWTVSIQAFDAGTPPVALSPLVSDPQVYAITAPVVLQISVPTSLAGSLAPAA